MPEFRETIKINSEGCVSLNKGPLDTKDKPPKLKSTLIKRNLYWFAFMVKTGESRTLHETRRKMDWLGTRWTESS
ncbi:hypothetical protein JP09_000375 [Dehalogenimonas etheniformans]|uniref:Uncharacterized protein n=1 Tax=Dehalogenimonas etheniformans TaxID=1536648 RepID=A0A2P5PA63_9CHLR|nr:hypothetical protein JP09_000375 [Dehalogenimonas etheniformans]